MKFLLLLFCLSSAIARAEYIISAEVDRSEVPLNGTFNFQIKIEYKGKNPTDISDPDFSSLKNFHVLGRSSGFQSHVSIVNTKATTTKIKTYTYRLQPKAKGKYQLKGLKIGINGKSYNINPVPIEIKEKSDSSISDPAPDPFLSLNLSPQQLFESIFDNSFPQMQKRPQGDIKFKLDLKKTAYYVGEMIKASWIVFTSSPRMQFHSHKKPILKGFLKEDLMSNDQPQFLGTEIINKTLYRKTLLYSRALFPIKTGDLEIDPYNIKITALSFSFGRSSEQIKTTKKQIIHVKALPEGGYNFSGSVGVFESKAWLEQKETPLNQPVTFRLRIFGEGHPQLIKLPKINFPSSFQIYPAVEHSEFSVQESFKEFEILLIPKVPGNILIPEFQFTTFDPHKEVYINHRIPSLSLKVLPGTLQAEGETEKFFLKREKNKRKASNPKKRRGHWFFSHKKLSRFWLQFYASVFCVFLLICLLPVIFKRRASFTSKVQHQLDLAKKEAKNKFFEKSSLRLIKLLHEVLLHLPGENVSDPISSLSPTLREKHGIALKELLLELEAAAYSQDIRSRSQMKMQNLINRTEKLIKQWLPYIQTP